MAQGCSLAVSVVLPVRNGLPYIREAVASILAQSFSAFELLVIDDGSTDGTREWLETQSESRLRVIPSAGTGVVAALNTGLSKARGALVARQDADDRSHPERLATQVAFLQDHPDVAVVGTLADFIDECGRPVETPWVADVRRVHDAACSPEALGVLLPLTCGLAHGTVMARTAILRKAGGYRAAFEWAEDYDLWLRLLPDHRFAKVPQRLYTHRLHAGQVSRERRDAQLARTIAAKLEYIRRRHPHITPESVVTIEGDGRGAAEYQSALERAGLTPGTPAGVNPAQTTADLVVVSDLAHLDRWRAQLPEREWFWEGNIAVRIVAGERQAV